MSNILEGREYYKPFKYQELFEIFDKHEKMHWVAEEVKLDDDLRHWNEVLGDNERKLLTELFRFFVGADSNVLDGYNVLIPEFHKTPEAAMMLSSIAAREGIHLSAYSLLLDTLGMPEDIYKSFLDIKTIKQKHDFVEKELDKLDDWKDCVRHDPEVFYNDYVQHLCKVLCIVGCFIEGFQLFSSFAILKNFEHTYKCMPGMNDIVDWSIRDEDLHIQACEKLFKTLLSEHSLIKEDKLFKEIQDICKKMVELEHEFIDLMFDAADNRIKGITKEEVKQFVVALANGRLKQFGIPEAFEPQENPLKWLDFLIYGKGHTNFFERRATEYGKGTIVGGVTEDAFSI